MTVINMESRFDPDTEFEIDRRTVSRDIEAGDIFSFRRPYWASPRPVMACMVTQHTVCVMEQRRKSGGTVAVKPHGRMAVRMLLLEDGT